MAEKGAYPSPSWDDWGPADESDVAVALFRTAFTIVLALAPFATHGPWETGFEAVLAASAGFNLILFASYLRHSRLVFRRPIAIVMDLTLVTTAVLHTEGLPYQQDQLLALYYVIVLVAAIWFRRPGALLTALVAGVLYSVARDQVSPRLEMLWRGQTPGLVLVAVASSYIVLARDRERKHAGQLENEISLARRLQQSMLPAQLAQASGLRAAVRFAPARQVGGDLYDAVALGQHRLLVCAGDMAGKSVYGLFHLSLVHSHLHAAATQGLEPAEIAEFVNRNVYEPLQPDSFAALFIGLANSADGTLTFVNCGHLPPLLLRPGGEVQELSSGGMVIGASRTPGYQQRVVRFAPGDQVVCYTDGIEEARNRRKEEFGVERVREVALAHAAEAPDALAEAVMAAAARFSFGPAVDDRTVLVLQRSVEVEA
jgi:serine phosphatase RsbU (regulator of sigma subunit)